MACMTLIANPVAMATTQFEQAIRCEVCTFVPIARREATPLRMSWFVTTAESGEHQLRMCWQTDQ